MSASGRVRLPLAAFLAAVLGGLGLGLALRDGDDKPSTPRAEVAPVVTTDLPTQQIPATPRLRLGTSPAGPAAAVGRVTPQQPQTSAPTGTAQPGSQTSRPSGSGNGLSVQQEDVTSP